MDNNDETHSFLQMDNSTVDETRVLPEKTPQRSPLNTALDRTQRHRLFVSHRRRKMQVNSETGCGKEMEHVKEPSSATSPTKYGYLEHIQSYKDSCRPNDKSLKKKVRRFYKDQLELITSIESILVPKSEEEQDKETASHNRQDRTVKIVTIVTLITNIVLVIIKIAAAVISRSLSVISSVVDSIVDLLMSIILMWTAHKIEKRDRYQYPEGRTRLEPIAVVILSVIMCSASVQIIFESTQTLIQDVQYFTNRTNSSSSRTLPEIDMSTLPIVAMVLTIVSKAVLFVFCHRIKNPTISAIAEDNRNDVVSNIVALACGLIGFYALQKKIRQEAIVVDPVGAIVISFYIIVTWIRQCNKQVRNLSGLTGGPLFLQRLTHVIYNYRPDVVTKIESVQAVHFGTKYFTEVDIGLPGSTPLAMAHGIGEQLQEQLERIDKIERAFVHLEFEFSHMPADDHKVV